MAERGEFVFEMAERGEFRSARSTTATMWVGHSKWTNDGVGVKPTNFWSSPGLCQTAQGSLPRRSTSRRLQSRAANRWCSLPQQRARSRSRPECHQGRGRLSVRKSRWVQCELGGHMGSSTREHAWAKARNMDWELSVTWAVITKTDKLAHGKCNSTVGSGQQGHHATPIKSARAQSIDDTTIQNILH
jgi:hypothetical protein